MQIIKYGCLSCVAAYIKTIYKMYSEFGISTLKACTLTDKKRDSTGTLKWTHL